MGISFSAGAKAEMCRQMPQKRCCALAECFGILLFCSSFTPDCVRIVTESREFAELLPKLFKKAFPVKFDVMPEAGASGKLVFQLTKPEKIHAVMEAYGFSPADTLALHVNLSVVEEDCCKAAFLRGAFLAGGSVTDPDKDYHLEIMTTHLSVSRETFALLREALDCEPKSVSRGGGRVLYLKQSDAISDLLVYLGAPVAAMGILEAKLEKELNNRVNRRCNCDDANISKVVDAAQEQLAAIRTLRARGELEKLPEKLFQAAQAREERPEFSLAELADMMNPPITKSAMSHRLKRLVQLAGEEKP